MLFVATEKYSPSLVDLRTRNITQDPSLAQTIFSDGAIAMVFEYGKSLQVASSINKSIESDNYRGIIKMPIDRLLIRQPYIEEQVADSSSGYFEQNGREVFRAVKLVVPGLIKEAITNAGLTEADIAWVIPHQGSSHILDVLSKDLNKDQSSYSLAVDITEGNWSSASIPKALAGLLEGGVVGSGDNLVFAGFGAGKGVFTSTAVVRLG